MITATNTIHIGRLRVKHSDCDQLNATSRLTHLLNTTDLYPASLPPSAILCVRRVHDPLPATIQLEQPLVRPPRAWEHAVQRRLDDLARRAVRPWHEAVLPHSNAVLFSDQAELLACLARDWLTGAVGQCWWWKLLVPTNSNSSVITPWLNQPAYVPAAFALLAQHAQLARFVSRWQSHQIAHMTHDLLRQFAITQPAELFGVNDDDVSSLSTATMAIQHVVMATLSDQARLAMLTHEQQILIGVATLLQRAPDFMRTNHWLPMLQTWQKTLNQPSSSKLSADESRSEPASFADEHHLTAVSDARQHQHQQPPPDHGSHADQASVYSTVNHAVERAEFNPLIMAEKSITASDDLVAETEPQLPQHMITTQLGGVLYLLNLAQRMGLYGDFTTPLTTGIRLNIWDFVARTARRLLRQRQPADPIWHLLATLRGTTILDQDQSSRMVTLLLPFVRRRLLSLLQIEDQHQLGAVVCEHQAQVFCTATHLDVVLNLNDLPLAIRMAGLDRDPGWIPAAGRFVRFHFA